MNHRSIVEDHPAIVPDVQCQHGFRLRSCGRGECVATRETMYLRATKEGRRSTSEPWPGSLGDIDIAIDLTESPRDYRMPTPYEALAPARGIAWAIVLGVAMVLVIGGLYLWWKAGL